MHHKDLSLSRRVFIVPKRYTYHLVHYLWRIAIISISIMALSGCTFGWLYQDTVEPFCIDMRNTPRGEKESSSQLQQISIPRIPGGRIMWDSNTIVDAAKAQGITEVAYCDRKVFRVLGGLWQSDSIIVYGE